MVKRTLLLSFYVLSAVVLGALLASLASGVPFLDWLSFSKSLSFHPVLDLNVLSLDLDFTMRVSVAQIITIGIAIFLYDRTAG